MTYNTDKRKPLTRKQRQAFIEAHYFTCYWCRGYIVDDQWDDEHVIAKEIMPPGSAWNDWSNRRPIHRHGCHKAKTALDRKIIAKSNRIRRENGPVDERRKRTAIPKPKKANWPTGQKIASRGFPKPPPRSG